MTDFFEKYWHDKFHHYRVNPSHETWKNINQELFTHQVKSMFSHYIVKPSSNVWKKVFISLWWKRFTTFSPYTFNIYYIVSAAIASLIIVSQLNMPSSEQPSSISNVVSTQTNTLNIPRSQMTMLHQTQAQLKLPATVTSPLRLIHNATNNKANYQQNESLVAKDVVENTVFLPLSSISAKQCDSLEKATAYNSYPFVNTPTIPLTLSHHAIGFFFAPVFTNATFSAKSGYGDTFFKNYSSMPVTTSLDYTASLFYEWQRYNFSVNVGLSCSKISHHYNYLQSQFLNDTVFSQQIINNSYYHSFHFYVLNLDSLLLTGDTVWICHTDSVLISQIDTVNHTQVTSQRKDTKHQTKFSFTTLEIPVLLGYTYSFGRIDFTVKGGVSLSYIMASTGTMASPYNDYGTIPVSPKTFRMFYMNAIGGVEATYHFSPRIALSIIPLYKQSITPVFGNTNPLNIKLHSFLLNVGLKYNLQ